MSERQRLLSTGSSDFADYLMRKLRCIELRSRLQTNELKAMTIALGAGLIDPDCALEHLAEVGALRLVTPSSVPLP
jgi:hypothetical protein